MYSPMSMAGEPLRVVLVGCGAIGELVARHVYGTLPECRVVAVADRVADRAGAVGDLLGVPGFASLGEALAAVPADAADLRLPHDLHAAALIEALDRDLHVLVEKPLATTAAGARELIQAAKDAGVTLMVGHTFEYNGAVWMLRELVQSRELGDVYYLDSSRLNLGLYQSDVNVVFDLAPHDISIANHVLGSTPTSVQAWGSRHIDPVFEDVAFLQLGYEDIGVQAHIHVSWLDPRKVRLITAVGSKKMAVYDDTNVEERIRIHDKAVVPGDGGGRPTYRHGPVTSPVVTFDEPLAVQARHFVDCLTTGAQPRTDGANGLAVVQVIEAAQLSLAQERKVLISEVSGEPVAGEPGITGLVPAPRTRPAPLTV